MTTEHPPFTGLARRERTGSQKRTIGVKNIQRMLPGAAHGLHGGDIPPGSWSGDTALMAMEDSYCDMWDRTEVIDLRTRSLFNVSLMIGVGNVGNQFELEYHCPAAIYNGATPAELEAVIVHARPYVGSPCAAWAMQSMVAALTKHDLLEPIPEADVARKERTGSEKRAIACSLIRRSGESGSMSRSTSRAMARFSLPSSTTWSSRMSTSTSGNGPRSWTVVPAAWSRSA